MRSFADPSLTDVTYVSSNGMSGPPGSVAWKGQEMASTNVKASRRPLLGQRRESRVQAWNLTMILVVLYVVNWSDKAVLGLVAQPLAKELHLSASQIGLVGSGFFLTFSIGGFLAGPLG